MTSPPPALVSAVSWQALGLEQTLAEALPELIQLRRHLHRHPELSGHEQQTAALVAGELRRWGWQVREGVGRTGVVGARGPPPPGGRGPGGGGGGWGAGAGAAGGGGPPPPTTSAPMAARRRWWRCG